jgi:hypothetical protein
MVKTGGENVASREVEEMIYQLPQVSEVAVIGVPHPRWVEAVVAVVVVKAGQSLSKAAVHAHCAAHLAHFKVPKDIVFADALPKPERQIAQARTAPRPRGFVCLRDTLCNASSAKGRSEAALDSDMRHLIRQPKKIGVSRALRGMKRSAMTRCRPGIAARREFVTIPDQRCTVSRCTASGKSL